MEFRFNLAKDVCQQVISTHTNCYANMGGGGFVFCLEAVGEGLYSGGATWVEILKEKLSGRPMVDNEDEEFSDKEIAWM